VPYHPKTGTIQICNSYRLKSQFGNSNISPPVVDAGNAHEIPLLVGVVGADLVDPLTGRKGLDLFRDTQLADVFVNMLVKMGCRSSFTTIKRVSEKERELVLVSVETMAQPSKAERVGLLPGTHLPVKTGKPASGRDQHLINAQAAQ